MKSLVLACLGAVLLSGCAYVDAVPTTRDDMHTHGFRMPERKPLIVVAGANTTVLFVCNNDRQVAFNFGSFLAKHHLKASFDGCGDIASLDSEQDNTTVALALITFLTEAQKLALPPGAAKSGNDSQAQGLTSFQIFDVRFSGDNVDLVPLVRPSDLLLVRASGGGSPVIGLDQVSKTKGADAKGDPTKKKDGETAVPVES